MNRSTACVPANYCHGRETRSRLPGACLPSTGRIIRRRTEAKISRLIEIGSKPFSVVSFHNRFFGQVRHAYVVGAAYPAATGTCALGERVLNHLVLSSAAISLQRRSSNAFGRVHRQGGRTVVTAVPTRYRRRFAAAKPNTMPSAPARTWMGRSMGMVRPSWQPFAERVLNGPFSDRSATTP